MIYNNNMIKGLIKRVKKQFKVKKDLVLLQSKEIEWAHNYHDSIRGIEFIENLNLNIGRWSGNYAFFYVLNRILKDYEPNKIIEFGLGESSKFISKYIENLLINSQHTIIEQSTEWKYFFTERFNLSQNSNIIICNLRQIDIKGFKVNSYENIENIVNQKYDLYIVDGPFGSFNYSRYDIVNVAKGLESNDEFMILIDDYDRDGEKQTTEELMILFKEKNIEIFKSVYEGNKSVVVLATKKYRYAASF